MKRSLFIVAMIMSSAAVVAAPNYENCGQDSNSEICQAYFAGLNQTKPALETASMKKDDAFRSRALEQRMGERTRKMELIDQKSVSPTK
ncbi:hypothetical protein ACFFLZ_16665 [Photobacterium aphoticum]|uniref:Uncharacterized protein n=1 Tax=Photobacterium aphoticum TaxID=754436 RepID=A0A090REN0_9GAMM|nr:hypothetical protein [Photobacterium aphoticum]KLV00765.1 hypothetical protein ABT58_11075 [Photobacterium aphoticum]PSU58245.1 hypothetical protein C9I90_06950 [Photobacterium aphoticum]GAL05992.1 hypothetical protein JCM19237_1632 [Photobacterium aphoticum]GHA50994.1 hypothetical protein GCM10007086_26120 [Photobacterium aphoticum]